MTRHLPGWTSSPGFALARIGALTIAAVFAFAVLAAAGWARQVECGCEAVSSVTT